MILFCFVFSLLLCSYHIPAVLKNWTRNHCQPAPILTSGLALVAAGAGAAGALSATFVASDNFHIISTHTERRILHTIDSTVHAEFLVLVVIGFSLAAAAAAAAWRHRFLLGCCLLCCCPLSKSLICWSPGYCISFDLPQFVNGKKQFEPFQLRSGLHMKNGNNNEKRYRKISSLSQNENFNTLSTNKKNKVFSWNTDFLKYVS